mgnify:CR=1 FL=1
MSEQPDYRPPVPERYSNATVALIVINVAVYLIGLVYPRSLLYLALIPRLVIGEHWFWQVASYMFVHGGMTHILFNMLALFIFGVPLERRLGSREFLLYYFVSGIGAGLATLAVNWYTGMASIPVVGASGAVYGVLLAYATFYPNTRIIIFWLLPVRAPVAVLIFAALALYSELTGTASGVAHLTHLAGLVFGFLYLLVRLRINPLRVFFRRTERW